MRDLQEKLIYRRINRRSRPHGGFIYVLHIPETNYIEYGLGWESRNGLQRKHIATGNVHELSAYETADAIRKDGVHLKLGSLAEMFTSDPEAQTLFVTPKQPDEESEYLGRSWTVPAGATDEEAKAIKENTPNEKRMLTLRGSDYAGELADIIREVHDAAWGNPSAWEPDIVSLGDGRIVWNLYDDDADRIRLGMGFIDEFNEPVLGDNSYMLHKDFIVEFVTRIWTGNMLFFFSVPPHWDSSKFSLHVDNPHDLRQIAAAILRLADKIWPGEIEAPDDD